MKKAVQIRKNCYKTMTRKVFEKINPDSIIELNAVWPDATPTLEYKGGKICYGKINGKGVLFVAAGKEMIVLDGYDMTFYSKDMLNALVVELTGYDNKMVNQLNAQIDRQQKLLEMIQSGFCNGCFLPFDQGVVERLLELLSY